MEILSVTSGTPGGSPKWMGCRAVGDTVRWIQDGSSCSSEIYASWHTRETTYELDRCFVFDEPNGKWYDKNCDSKRDFACNRPGGKYDNTIPGRYRYRYISFSSYYIYTFVCLFIINIRWFIK